MTDHYRDGEFVEVEDGEGVDEMSDRMKFSLWAWLFFLFVSVVVVVAISLFFQAEAAMAARMGNVIKPTATGVEL